MERLGVWFVERPYALVLMVALALAGLPFAVWMDLRTLSDQTLRAQAETLQDVITDIRGYYASEVVARADGSDQDTVALHDYLATPGAIPIPATLSLDLGKRLGQDNEGLSYRFVSDAAFTDRAPHVLTAFEASALQQFRDDPTGPAARVDTQGTLLNRTVTVATPVAMGQACIACHNAHPLSPRKDWKVGDVRGIQAVTVTQAMALNLTSFTWLLGYLVIAGSAALLVLLIQFRMSGRLHRLSSELTANNEFLAGVSMKISKYLSPQIYKSIFSGEKDATISTERKKLTVFFSDIKDFTATTEAMQPEELTALLNEYFTEMSKIAAAHGATIDKFIGDAIVAFFGDPETKGTKGDAQACVHMALAMQDRLTELEADWRTRGVARPFRVRMGINTGYCNVGNFGSDARMDYTIIGAEANLAARLEGIAEPGGIVMSYETYALVQDLIDAVPGEPQQFKGIARDVTPYHVVPKAEPKIMKPAQNDDVLFVDLGSLNDQARARVRRAIETALGDVTD